MPPMLYLGSEYVNFPFRDVSCLLRTVRNVCLGVKIQKPFVKKRGWEKKLKGKARAMNNTREKLEAYKEECKMGRREDKLPEIQRMLDTINACIDLVAEGRVKEAVNFDAAAVSTKVRTIGEFLEDCHKRSGEEGSAPMVEPQLFRLQVASSYFCSLFFSFGVGWERGQGP